MGISVLRVECTYKQGEYSLGPCALNEGKKIIVIEPELSARLMLHNITLGEYSLSQSLTLPLVPTKAALDCVLDQHYLHSKFYRYVHARCSLLYFLGSDVS